ncbi:hypothetical protein OY671_008422, partial [Metschnikowia pulcherrima]
MALLRAKIDSRSHPPIGGAVESASDTQAQTAQDQTMQQSRTGSVARKTAETDIAVSVNLDGTGAYDVSTGIGFLDHMVEQFSRHSSIDVTMRVVGDSHVDQHHTTEDSAIASGQAITQASGDKKGIARYGTAYSPM